jgi:hypothetical protein
LDRQEVIFWVGSTFKILSPEAVSLRREIWKTIERLREELSSKKLFRRNKQDLIGIAARKELPIRTIAEIAQQRCGLIPQCDGVK